MGYDEMELDELRNPNYLSPKEAKQWAMLCHLSALIGTITGVGFILGPLVVWLIKRDDHPFIDEQGKEAVNFQLSMLIAALLCLPLIIILIGIFLELIIILLVIVMPIVAAIKAGEGRNYRYPFTIRFLN